MDLERGASDVGEDFVPQIEAGYFAPLDAPTEVSWWIFGLGSFGLSLMENWATWGFVFCFVLKNLACV